MESAFLLIMLALVCTVSLLILLIGFTVYYDGKKRRKKKKQNIGIAVIVISLLPVALMGLFLIIWALILYVGRK